MVGSLQVAPLPALATHRRTAPSPCRGCPGAKLRCLLARRSIINVISIGKIYPTKSFVALFTRQDRSGRLASFTSQCALVTMLAAYFVTGAGNKPEERQGPWCLPCSHVCWPAGCLWSAACMKHPSHIGRPATEHRCGNDSRPAVLSCAILGSAE